jgi:hypothetical protein
MESMQETVGSNLKKTMRSTTTARQRRGEKQKKMRESG